LDFPPRTAIISSVKYLDVNINIKDSEIVSTQATSGVHIWLVLMKAFHALSAATTRTLRDNDLGDSDFRVLEVLLHKGALPVNTIGAKVFLTTGSISTAVDRLVQKGLVSRTGSDTDRRVHIVELTAKGRTLITPVFNAHAKRLEEIARVLSLAERAQLVAGLKKIGKNAEDTSDDGDPKNPRRR
jgi:MarR family 2-MHQ and catechol resistance regulon transcriptional repressor